MRKLFFIPIAALLFACDNTPKDASELNLEDFKERISYALGSDMAASFANIPEEEFNSLDHDAIEEVRCGTNGVEAPLASFFA